MMECLLYSSSSYVGSSLYVSYVVLTVFGIDFLVIFDE